MINIINVEKEQQLVKGIAQLMLHIAQRYDFSKLEMLPSRVDEKGLGAVGESMVDLVMFEMKHCKTSSKEQLERSIARWRMVYARHLEASEFRRGAKRSGKAWDLHIMYNQGKMIALAAYP